MLRRVLRGLGIIVVASSIAAGLALALLRQEPTRQPLEARPPSAAADGAATNVVLVIGCTTRANQTTPYGAPTHVSPFLEEMAQGGTRFAFAISQAPWTRPAIATILTSRHASAIGLTEPGSKRNHRPLPEAVTTLGEHMHESGRATFGFAANPNASSTFGFAQGFDEYWDGSNPWHGPVKTKVPGQRVVAEALETLRSHQEKGGGPFYLQLVLIDAHLPDESSWLDEARYLAADLPRRVARYRARVNRLDAAVEALHEGLAELGYTPENTLFVFIADHGEGLAHPRHHGPAHGTHLNTSVLGVPWILRGPGVARGHVVEGIVGQIDLLPTLLGLLSLPASSEATGYDWSRQVAGESQRATREVAFAETWFGRTERSAVYTRTAQCQLDFRTALTRENQKKLQARGELGEDRFASGCFDLVSDPLAARAVENPELMAKIAPFHERLLEQRRSFGEAEAVPLDPDLQSKLEALGYAE